MTSGVVLACAVLTEESGMSRCPWYAVDILQAIGLSSMRRYFQHHVILIQLR